jgi:RND family efflux transporter MFP subunit
VRRGEVLIILDAHDTRLGASQAAAGARSADQSVRAAEAEIAATTAALALATATHGRVAALYAKRSATAEELDRATAERAAAESAAAAAAARHEAAMAAREGAHDGADAAGVTAGYATLTAPFDGIVTDRRVDPGSMATPGATLLTVEDSARYRLEIQADQTRAAGLRPGQVAEVQIDGLGDASAWTSAEVAEIGRLDPASHGFLVKIDLPANGAWRSGLFGRARFPEAARRAVTAPNSALVRRGQITFVFLEDGDHARLRPVSTGVRLGDRVEVLAGLRPGDRVVADPALTLADGARIRGAVR